LNIQNIPKDNKYRNGFIPPEGWKVVSSDYTSQEIVVLAYMTKEKVFLDALKERRDLHNICAELVFGYKWKQATVEDCAFYQIGKDGKPKKGKCDCPGHNKLRNQVKSISFGLIYGMSAMKLSRDLEITLPEAENLMKLYFKTFPAIGRILDYLGNFGVTKGYIQTIAPFFRKRVFEEWSSVRHHIDEHIMGIQYHPVLGGIQRQSMNCPIQGASADITKTAIYMVWEFLRENNLWDGIHLCAQVHDELCSFARADLAEWWAVELSRIMEEAALFVIPNGLLKTDTTITDKWNK
jgi:DNA polymerase-1